LSVPGLPRLIALVLAVAAAIPAGAQAADVRGETLQVRPGVRFYDVLARSPEPGAPLMLYLAGGPGASSLAPLLVGNGPWSLVDPFGRGRPVVRDNPWSFTRLANVVYLDQPRHTGFSTGRAPYVTSVAAAGADVVAWLRAFDRRHRDLAVRPLILAGESFAGAYVADLTRRMLAGEGRRHRLAGVFLEAPSLGRTDAAPAATEVDAACAMGLVDAGGCAELRAALARCGGGSIAAVAASCPAVHAQLALQPTRVGELRFGHGRRVPPPLRGQRIPQPLDGLQFPAGGLIRRHLGYSPNPYDVALPCRPSGGFPPWCYDTRKLTALLDAPAMRRRLGGGIPAALPWRFADFRVSVALSFRDRPQPNAPYAAALRAGVPVTIVFGGRDWVVNAVTGRWLTDRIARAAGPDAAARLTVALLDAGHLVGLDQPEQTYRLLEKSVSSSAAPAAAPAPSISSIRRLVRLPPRALKPPSRPPEATTRWQGTTIGTGLWPIAWPTAWAAPASPSSAATSP
jgi:alpha-beta hydrolase superfamily lysophospholipase